MWSEEVATEGWGEPSSCWEAEDGSRKKEEEKKEMIKCHLIKTNERLRV